MRRGIAPIRGSRIEACRWVRSRTIKPISVRPTRRTFGRRVKGRAISALERAGKRVVLLLDSGDRVVFEPRMTGLVLLEGPPSQKHLRVRLELSGGAAPELLFWDRRGLGTLSLLSPQEFAEQLGPDKLGPDALSLESGVLRTRLGTSRRAIKVALLDQRAVAGIGNIYAAETLHVARIHPTRPCASLAPREWRALEAAIREVLEEAVRYEGSDLGDGTYRSALEGDGTYQVHHRVYGREEEPCPRCRNPPPIERIVLAQRATFYCGRCQR